MKPYRGDRDIMQRLGQNAPPPSPLPSMNRIAQDCRDALAEIERLRRSMGHAIGWIERNGYDRIAADFKRELSGGDEQHGELAGD